MFFLFVITFGLMLGYIRGGRLKWLAERPLSWKGLAFLALLIQLVIFSETSFWKTVPQEVTVFLHLVSYLCILVFIFVNRKVSGIPLIGTGILLNALAIYVNGGYMPTFSENLKNTSMSKYAETISQGSPVNNSIEMSHDTLLPWLGDIFALPSWIPLSNVFSIGDVLIAFGACLYLLLNMKPPEPFPHQQEHS